MRARVTVGPVDGHVARTWLENSRSIVAALRARRPATLDVSDPVLDLIDAYLSMWHAAAQHAERFEWSVDVDTSDLEVIATHWQRIAALSDDELAALGCRWAPEWTAPMYDALVEAFVTALAGDPDTAEAAARFAARPPGSVGDDG